MATDMAITEDVLNQLPANYIQSESNPTFTEIAYTRFMILP